jgi:hypothetical protein
LLAGGGENAQIIWEQAVALLPATPLRQRVELSGEPAVGETLRLQLADQEGEVLLDHNLRD